MVTATQVLLEPGDHVVQFYESEHDLSATVGAHLAQALRSGDAAVVLADAAHREAFAQVLTAAGIDVRVARGSGQLLEVDAADALAQFMVNGAPDGAAFDAAMGPLVQQAAAGGRRVWAYGEMVALLWEQGQVGAAIEVEGLWNQLGERLAFSLFCAYPSHLVLGGEFVDAFDKVCHLHSAVIDSAIPEEPTAAVVEQFPATLIAPRDARHLVARTLEAWGRVDLVDDASLAVTELATNAVVHAHSDFELTLTTRDGVVRVAVRDSSRAEPFVRPPSQSASSGRGMILVEAIGSQWGCELEPDGKQVWVEFAAAEG